MSESGDGAWSGPGEGDNLLELLIWNCPVEDILWVMPLLLQGGCPVNVPSATGAVPLVTACKRGLGQANLVKVVLLRISRLFPLGHQVSDHFYLFAPDLNTEITTFHSIQRARNCTSESRVRISSARN